MAPRRLGVAAAFVDGDIVAGDVELDGDRLVAVGVSPAGKAGLAVPALIDLQVNGYAGVDVRDADIDGYELINATLARDGVGAWLPTVPTSDAETTIGALRSARLAMDEAALTPTASLLGVHLEGPFLSPARKGAHPLSQLRPIDSSYLQDLRAEGPVRLVTLAPELPGSLDMIRELVAAGVTVSIGHTDATAAQAHAAFDAGAAAHTHVGNAHRPINSRDPGPAAVALSRHDVTPCLICDLAHVHGDALLVSVRAAAARYVLVTDANAVTSARDGSRSPRVRDVVARDGAARLADGSLCGGAFPLHRSVRNLVELGRPLPEVLASVTSRPAQLIGEPDRGRLLPGTRGDVVVIDDALEPAAVFLGGQEVH